MRGMSVNADAKCMRGTSDNNIQCGVTDGETSQFSNTETNHPAALPGLGKDGESPEGPGRDGNKPLMKNRTANEVPSPIGIIPATLL